MNRLICSIFFLLLSCIGFSQKTFFVYIQSEGEQSFFVKMNDRNISSSSSGYVILSQLKDSTYNFKIGFPQNKWPEQEFSVAIRANDHGFLLKNFNEKGWGLFDLQTLSVQMSGKGETAKIKRELQPVSLFTEVLSKAANDPSLRERPVFAVQKEENPTSQEATAKQDDPVKERETVTEQKDKPAVASDTGSATVAAPIVANKVTQKEAPARNQPGKRDTVDVFSVTKKIEEPKADTAGNTSETALTDKPSTNTPQSLAQKEEPARLPQGSTQVQEMVKEKKAEKNTSTELAVKKDVEQAKIDAANEITGVQEIPQSNKENVQSPTTYRKSIVLKKSESSTLEGLGLVFIDQYPGGEKDTIDIMIPNTAPAFKTENTAPAGERKFLNIDDPKENVSSFSIKRNHCKAVAMQNDFLKLRKKMAGQKEEEAMLEEAKKEFKSLCYTSEQVKNLGALFLNEPAKFQFYEAAYPNCSDPGGFAVLQNELKDPYFIHRFKNMIK